LVKLYGEILVFLSRSKGYFDQKKISEFSIALTVPIALTRQVRIVSSCFRDKSEFLAMIEDINKAQAEVSEYAAIICREGTLYHFETQEARRPV
jgi:hypothetical protein